MVKTVTATEAGQLAKSALKTIQKKPSRQQHKLLQTITKAHVDSFDFMINEALPQAVSDIFPVEFEADGRNIVLSYNEVTIGQPSEIGKDDVIERSNLPAECRERRISYRGRLNVSLSVQVEGEGSPWLIEKSLGMVPIMVKSKLCHLHGLTPEELISKHEEAEEMGGYFIVNGNEKIIRLLIMQRRHQVLGIIRNSFTKRGDGYTEYGCSIRCVRPDQTSQTLVLHYKSDGTCVVGFSYRKAQYLIPAILILRALAETNDKEIFDAVLQGNKENTFLVERVHLLLSESRESGLYSKKSCLAYLGSKFRVVLDAPPRYTDEQVGRVLLQRLVFVHIDEHNMSAKFNLLVHMIQKLYSLVGGECQPDNADSAINQELLLPGQLYNMILKELLQEYILQTKRTILKDINDKKLVDFSDSKYLRKTMRRMIEPGKKMEYVMATGNVSSPSGLDLMQTSGFTVVADKLNFFRYLSHFRCVHRGAFFTTMKTTTVRKLLPDSWGFLCPVHTPDGSPCGLLMHLTASAQAVNVLCDTSRVANQAYKLGVVPLGMALSAEYITVALDGVIIGHVDNHKAQVIADQLRMLKIDEENEDIPTSLEIALVLQSVRGQYPGLYLFSQPARFIRPVRNLRVNKTEMIGSFEQAYMNIACDSSDFAKGITTHIEENKTNFISVIANMTPFSDFNQSPRNMYQCQMGKQTMGYPCHAYPHRADNKLYCLRTPQIPMVRTRSYNDYGFDEFPLGTNAIVAVISYTGYDMEDAMILSKSSKERGFASANVVKTQLVDLANIHGMDKSDMDILEFGALEDDPSIANGKLDMDGFPPIGTKLTSGDPLFGYINLTTKEMKIDRYKGEDAYVIQVSRLGNFGDIKRKQATIKLSVNRNPIIGDKFASRHGQKGICSQLWPAADMPFTESGMTPDILFNPHGFPSRMTIGMLVESMAGKSGALHGVSHDATPFNFSEEQPASEYFGEQLRKAGYNYYGTERMYSGIAGTEFDADIFIGIVYYQRLRHMVSDKFQVRTTGPVHNLTHQPIKGRKRGGGVRFGEMERDSLLSHGASFLLQDRLLHNSDTSEALVCKECGSLVSPIMEKTIIQGKRNLRCAICSANNGMETDARIVQVTVPYVFRYLAAELLSMNIRIKLDIEASF
eukprot:m.95259 g.95259  ORF g.95259 m.95259 type:complete len:1143 (+) comp13484_c0_seq4:183-3611(+)